jgi:hypothetical protein
LELNLIDVVFALSALQRVETDLALSRTDLALRRTDLADRLLSVRAQRARGPTATI